MKLLSVSDALTLWTVRENLPDILLLLTYSVGDHGTCKNCSIHCTDVFKLLEWSFLSDEATVIKSGFY